MRTSCLFTVFILLVITVKMQAQSDTTYFEVNSQMWFVSEIDHSLIIMDDEGNQFDHYDNYIVVKNKEEKLKIPYDSNYIFWDEYDENMNVKKMYYNVVIQEIMSKLKNNDQRVEYKLFKVSEGERVIYDATKVNPFIH